MKINTKEIEKPKNCLEKDLVIENFSLEPIVSIKS